MFGFQKDLLVLLPCTEQIEMPAIVEDISPKRVDSTNAETTMNLSINSRAPNLFSRKTTLATKKKTLLEQFNARKAEYEEEVRVNMSRKDRLQDLLSEARTVGYSLVHLSKPWSEREPIIGGSGIRVLVLSICG